MWRLRPAVLAGAFWATLAALLVRRRLKHDGVGARVPPPPHLGRGATRGVMGALGRLKPTCLERALVLQTWLAAQGTLRDVVIGVPRDGMKSAPAHAWVDGTDTVSPANYLELHRLRPPTPAN
jgi:transglutaminase superfamily protein